MMIEADWIPGSMHAQPSLTVEKAVAGKAFTEGEGGTHAFLAPWLCWGIDDIWTEFGSDRFNVDS